MVIALLAVLGVVVDGEVPGLGPKCQRGYGRWVRDVLVCTKAPLLFATSWWPSTGRLGGSGSAEPGEVKRVGSDPVILPLAADGGGRVEVATASDDAGGHWGRWQLLRRHRLDPDKGADRAAGKPVAGVHLFV